MVEVDWNALYKTAITCSVLFLAGQSTSSQWEPGVRILVSIAIALTGYTIYGAIWRLYFSPIAHIPGPKLAALTLWVEFYYDVVLMGRYTFKLQEWHERYGWPPSLPSPHSFSHLVLSTRGLSNDDQAQSYESVHTRST